MRALVMALLSALAMGSAAEAQKLDPSRPADAIAAYRKIQCSTKDNVPVVYHWSGRVYSRVPGEPDRHLFNIEGMNVRQCVTVTDPAKGKGFRLVSRELMFYIDPKTGQALKTWDNPWTSKTVDVIHVANDPVNSRPTFPVDDKGQPYTLPGRFDHGRFFMPFEVPLFYTNAMGGPYQDYVGNQYHAMEIFDFVADENDLLDARKTTARPTVAWVRISQWLPWMQMNSRVGNLVFNAVGHTVPGIDALPPVIRQQIATDYQIYREPPPGDDARPNETSWTYFKKIFDAKKSAAPAATGH